MNIELLKRNFAKRNYQVSYFKSKEEVKKYFQNKYENEIIGFGASQSLRELELYECLSKDNIVIWHWKNPGYQTLDLAKSANIYFSSANGVSETGDIVNIDGTGNRISMLSYGPKKAYIIVGKNKIAPSLKEAMLRAQHIAGPLNAKRLNKNTPCVHTGVCIDCNSKERICKGMLILNRPMSSMEIEVVFVDMHLGY